MDFGRVPHPILGNTISAQHYQAKPSRTIEQDYHYIENISKLIPNLILSAIDSPVLQDQLHIFMSSLGHAISQELPVEVNTLVLPSLAQELSPSLKAHVQKFPSLEFDPFLSVIRAVKVELARLKGWANYFQPIAHQYNNVLVTDLDIVFRRNPFSVPLYAPVELLFYAERRAMKIGQCKSTSPGLMDASKPVSSARKSWRATHGWRGSALVRYMGRVRQ
jgi:hypothetical protein